MTTQRPASISQLYPRKWLTAADLGGQPRQIDIAYVVVEEIYNPQKGEKEWKAIIDYGGDMRMILNKTQCRALEQITDSENFADWRHLAIVLSPAKSPNGKGTIEILAALVENPVEQPSLNFEFNIGDEVMVAGKGDERLGFVTGFSGSLITVSVDGAEYNLSPDKLTATAVLFEEE